MRVHDFSHYVFAAIGSAIAVHAPLSGTAIIAVSLIAGVAYRFVSHADYSESKALIDAMSLVVNTNAKKLEEVVALMDKLQNDFSFMQSARGLGLR